MIDERSIAFWEEFNAAAVRRDGRPVPGLVLLIKQMKRINQAEKDRAP